MKLNLYPTRHFNSQLKTDPVNPIQTKYGLLKTNFYSDPKTLEGFLFPYPTFSELETVQSRTIWFIKQLWNKFTNEIKEERL